MTGYRNCQKLGGEWFLWQCGMTTFTGQGIVDAFVGSCGGHGMGNLVLLYVSLLCTESYQPHLQES